MNLMLSTMRLLVEKVGNGRKVLIRSSQISRNRKGLLLNNRKTSLSSVQMMVEMRSAALWKMNH